MSTNINPAVGQPIRSAQTYLRQIAYEYKEVPLVVPDGIFGEQTTEAVVGFQSQFGLETTGEIDNVTWDRMVSVYKSIMEKRAEPRRASIYPNYKEAIMPGEADRSLLPIQAVMLLLTQEFNNLGTLEITGVNDPPTTAVVKKLQDTYGMEKNGVIEKQFWNRTAGLYEAHVTRSQFLERRSAQSPGNPMD